MRHHGPEGIEVHLAAMAELNCVINRTMSSSPFFDTLQLESNNICQS